MSVCYFQRIVFIAGLLSSINVLFSASPKVEYEVQKVIHNISKYKTHSLWNGLPKSYKNDVNFLIKEAAKVIEPDVYDQFVAAHLRFAQVVKSKKRLLVKYWYSKNSSQIAALRQRFSDVGLDFESMLDVMTEVLIRLAESEFSNHKNLGDIKMEVFFRNDVNRILKVIAKQLPKFRFELENLQTVSVNRLSGNSRAAKIEVSGLQNNIVLDLIKVDSRWVPKHLYTSWNSIVQQIKQNISRAKVNKYETNIKLRIALLAINSMTTMLSGANSIKDLDLFFSLFNRNLYSAG